MPYGTDNTLDESTKIEDFPGICKITTRRIVLADDRSALRVKEVVLVDYELATSQMQPSVLSTFPIPAAPELSSSCGLVISNKLPNWIATYVALHARGYAWIAGENPHLAKSFPNVTDGIGWAIVCISSMDEVAPGTIFKWTQQKVVPITDGQPPDRQSVIQVYSIFDNQHEMIVNVVHPEFLEPAYISQALLPLPDDAQSNLGISISNARPVWLNIYLAWQATQFGFRYVALCNPNTLDKRVGRFGSIVVYSRDPSQCAGSFIDNSQFWHVGRELGNPKRSVHFARAGLAIAIVGVPHSGKSVLTRALFELTSDLPYVFRQEANPDGEGMYYQNVKNAEYIARIRHKWPFTSDLAESYYRHILEYRKHLNILWVGLGGRPSDQSERTLQACTHAILLKRNTVQRTWDKLPACQYLVQAMVKLRDRLTSWKLIPRSLNGIVLKRADLDDAGTLALDQWRLCCRSAGVPIIAELDSQLNAERSATRSVTCDDQSKVIYGIAAKLDRGNSQSTQYTRPIAAAVLEYLLPQLEKSIDPQEASLFRQRIADLSN